MLAVKHMKTEKYCEKPMFLLSQNDKNQFENGSKNSKSASGPGHQSSKKDVANQKIEVRKLKNTGFFLIFRLPILNGYVHENISSVLFFYNFFLKASITNYQKQEI